MSIQRTHIPDDSTVFGQTASAFAKFEYSAAVLSHGFLFIAGVVGRRADGTAGGTVAEQTELALARITEILRLNNLDLSALVDVTSYHVGIRSHLAEFLEAKKRLVHPPYPAWSMIGISALASPELLIEIRATAALPDERP